MMDSANGEPEIESAPQVVVTAASLCRDLLALGIGKGDTVFVHSSLKSLGSVESGAETVIHALETALGPEGLLLMPSFNLIDKASRASAWDVSSTPAMTGWVSEVFRKMPGTVRSDHYSHSVAAWGRDAAEWVSADNFKEGTGLASSGFSSPWDLAPWMSTFGPPSPIYRCYEREAKVLMLGTDYYSLTFMHLVEVMDWNRRLRQDPLTEYRWLHRDAAGEAWERMGSLRVGHVGMAVSRLFEVRVFVDAILALIETDASLFKSWPTHSPTSSL